MSGLVEWARDYIVKPGGFWANLPKEDPEPLGYDIYDDSEATDEERMFALRLAYQIAMDDLDCYDITAKAVAAALARRR